MLFSNFISNRARPRTSARGDAFGFAPAGQGIVPGAGVPAGTASPTQPSGQVQAPQQGRGWFGEDGRLREIGAMLLTAQGNPLGNVLLQQRQDRVDAVRRQQADETRRQADWQDWLMRERWKRDHPAEVGAVDLDGAAR